MQSPPACEQAGNWIGSVRGAAGCGNKKSETTMTTMMTTKNPAVGSRTALSTSVIARKAAAAAIREMVQRQRSAVHA
jgi:hypothetical protein